MRTTSRARGSSTAWTQEKPDRHQRHSPGRETGGGGPARGPGPVAAAAQCLSGRIGVRQAMLDRHERVARRFATACGTGDAAALKAVLSANAMVVTDGGGKVRAAARPTCGADAVARLLTALLTGRPCADVAVESVNGRAGLVLRRAGQAVAVVSVSVARTRVTAVWVVLNPDKLRRWHRP